MFIILYTPSPLTPAHRNVILYPSISIYMLFSSSFYFDLHLRSLSVSQQAKVLLFTLVLFSSSLFHFGLRARLYPLLGSSLPICVRANTFSDKRFTLVFFFFVRCAVVFVVWLFVGATRIPLSISALLPSVVTLSLCSSYRNTEYRAFG